MKYADKLGCRAVVIIGEDEIKEGRASVKFMYSGEQESVSLDGDTIYEYISSKLS